MTLDDLEKTKKDSADVTLRALRRVIKFASNRKIRFFEAATLLLVYLKATGHLALPWYWVLMPAWLDLAGAAILTACFAAIYLMAVITQKKIDRQWRS